MIGRLLKAFRSWPKHPIDGRYGIETSARVRGFVLKTGHAAADKSNVGYAGSQPSIVRHCLELLPDLKNAVFFDLGCGKGRVLAVATEYPFAAITGIELSPAVCKVAEKNCARVASRHPERTRATLLNGDATKPPLPDSGLVVLYMYNPFFGDMVAALVDHVQAHMRAHPDLKVWVVYYNPVHGDQFDKSDLFTRFYAARHTFAEDERNSSPFGNDYDCIVVWQGVAAPVVPALPNADRRIEVTVPELMAEVRE